MKSLILLHGALGHAEQLSPLANLLKNDYQVHTFNFSGHGGKAMSEALFSIASFAEEVLEYIQAEKLEDITIFGYSMGGYIAMYLAKNYPGKITRVITLATKYTWSEAIAEKEVKMLDPEQTLIKVPAFAEVLKQRHAPADWQELMKKTASMLNNLGKDNLLKPEDFVSINTPCLLLLGDRDKMISLEETIQVYQLLPNACMGMLPATGHVIEKPNWNVLKTMITEFK